MRHAKVEPSLANAAAGSRFQFERIGYFCVDPDSAKGPRLQPHRLAARHVGEDSEKGLGLKTQGSGRAIGKRFGARQS